MEKYSAYENFENKKYIRNKICKILMKETGSITSMVTVTIIFFIILLSSTYMLMAAQRKTQLKRQLSTKESYQEEIDNASEIYYTLIGDDANINENINIKEDYEENTYTNKNVYVYSKNNKKFSVIKDGNQIAADQISYTLTEDGTYTISTNKGTELEEHIVKIDKTQPIVNNIEVSDVTSNSYKIKVNVEDVLSGIKQIRYSVDDGKSWKTSTENITECEIQYSGVIINNISIKIEVQDKAQNINTSSKIVAAKDVKGITIPEGFVYVGGTIDSGIVISDNVADKEKYNGQKIVGKDLEGNQFVWIPVDSVADYKRRAYSWNVSSGIIDTNTNSEEIKYNSPYNADYFVEKLAEDEKKSVETNKGFYIGRYEAGDKESTDAKKLRAIGASTSNTVVVKAGQVPYNYLKYTDAKKLAEEFSVKQGYTSVKSKLTSSYAWDTAIEFIQKINSDYGSNSKEGNHLDTIFTYKDITGAIKIKANASSGSGTLIPTGQTTSVSNIYDMGGNVETWTTETYSNTRQPYTFRGGDFNSTSSEGAAGIRYACESGYISSLVGIRIVLYL